MYTEQPTKKLFSFGNLDLVISSDFFVILGGKKNEKSFCENTAKHPLKGVVTKWTIPEYLYLFLFEYLENDANFNLPHIDFL